MARKKKFFNESYWINNTTYLYYLDRLTELSISMFEWKNVPPTVDTRFLELILFSEGQAVFFKDEVLGYLALKTTASSGFDVYRIPLKRVAIADNGYQNQLTIKDSVIIFNNMLHTNSVLAMKMYARRLANLDRTIEVNANAQKTPMLISCSEQQRLTMVNMFKEIDGNTPVIFGDKNLDVNAIKAFKTDAPYVCDKLYDLKTQIWNEALTYLGISNINIQKKERLITDEVTRNQGGTVASRYSRLETRKDACDKINAMFGLSMSVEYREDFQEIPEMKAGDNNE